MRKYILYVPAIFLLGLSLFSTSTPGFTQSMMWAKQIGGNNSTIPASLKTDISGNVYAVGSFTDTADFDGSAAVFELNGSIGYSDGFAVKLDSAGNFVWAKQFKGNNYIECLGIAVSNTGDSYICGWFDGTADFDPGVAAFNLTAAQRDIFVVSLDASGNFSWAKQFSGVTVADWGESYSIDIEGSDLYITGIFSGDVDFDPNAGTALLSATGTQDVFISKLSTAGNFGWAKQLAGPGDDYGYGICANSTHVYIGGSFSSTVDFNPGAGTSNVTSNGFSDVFVLKLDAAGNFVWVKTTGDANYDEAYGITEDASGNILSVGYYDGIVDFDPGVATFNLTSQSSEDAFIQKLDASGNFVWAKSLGGNSSDVATSVATDATGDVYTAGHFSLTSDFDPGAGTSLLSSTGLQDMFISALTSAGNFSWARQIGGTNFDLSNFIHVDGYGAVYIIGSFTSGIDADPGAGVLTFNPFGSEDGLILKMKSPLGIEESNSENRFFFYPNPVTHVLNVSGDNYVYAVKLYNTLGELMFSEKLHAKSLSLNFSGLTCGMYVIHIETDEGTVIKKVIKE
ncbi:MAG: T9SS type A sorting domain-containing protein [Flavobacteriales bacterium]